MKYVNVLNVSPTDEQRAWAESRVGTRARAAYGRQEFVVNQWYAAPHGRGAWFLDADGEHKSYRAWPRRLTQGTVRFEDVE